MGEKKTASKGELTDSQIEQVALETGEALAGEKQVMIKIPHDPLNREDATVSVCVNGYLYRIRRGETVKVPQTVADLLERAKYI